MSFSSDDSDDDVPPPPPPPPPAPSAGKGQQRAPSAVAEEELEIQMTPTLESLMHRNAVDKAEGDQEVEINLENAAPSRGLESTAENDESGDEATSSGRKKKGLLAILALLLIGGGGRCLLKSAIFLARIYTLVLVCRRSNAHVLRALSDALKIVPNRHH